MKLKLISLTVPDAVSLADARNAFKVIGTDSDADITRVIAAATELAAQITNRQLSSVTYEGYLDEFAYEVKLPKPPLVSVASVKYKDAAGTLQTLDAASYEVDDVAEPAVIYFNTLPSDVKRTGVNNVVITFECGYAADKLPAPIKEYILNVGLTRFENREGEVLGTIVNTDISKNVERMLDSYRIIP